MVQKVNTDDGVPIIFHVVDVLNFHTIAETCVCIHLRPLQTELLYRTIRLIRILGMSRIRTTLFVGCTFGKLVEDVEVSFILYLAHNTSLLEKIIGDLSTDWLSMRIEHDFQVFSLYLNEGESQWKTATLTCRLELLFRNVFAHPKLSNSGLVASTMSLIS